MAIASILIAGYTTLLLLVLSHHTCSARSKNLCVSSFCGHIHNIPYPFRLKTDPKRCGNKLYELACENNLTVLYLYPAKYYVESINYNNYTIRVVDTSLQKDNASEFGFKQEYPNHIYQGLNYEQSYPYLPSFDLKPIYESLVFVSCANSVNFPSYRKTSPCNNRTYNFSSSSSHLKAYTYVIHGATSPRNLVDSCSIDIMVMTSLLKIDDVNDISCLDVHDLIVNGFELPWGSACCEDSKELHCDDFTRNTYCPPPFFKKLIAFLVGLALVPAPIAPLVAYHAIIFIFGAPFIISFLVYKWQRRNFFSFDNIEEFLKKQHNFMPIRYSYLNIKKITKSFKNKLGEGGYNFVYKEKFCSGIFIVVKMLNSLESDRQDFINEVAIIGRIHRVNMVKLIGFYYERSKRTLVYDFMPNRSLDKYLFSQDGSMHVSNEKMFEIALGVTRGIEYLHQGCNMQILHFNIKFHNILLDERFIPKISDFGLARLYPTNNNTITLTAARETISYMASKLFYKNIEGISYKIDVYSYGTLLLEMAGRRKNLNAIAERTSEIYFPTWIYNQYSKGKNVELGDSMENERDVIKKMIVVAFWCIQLMPGDRPSMHKVVEMLEGDVESLEIPPKPVFGPQKLPKQDILCSTNSTGSSNSLTTSDPTVSVF